jgi:spoIIIJ-associated protein
VEASGKTLPEAKEVVLDLLGVAEDDAEFVVVSEPKAGLFGRMRGEARVQARVRPVAPPPKRGRRQRTERSRSRTRPPGAKGAGNTDRSQSGAGEDGAPKANGSTDGKQGDRESGSGARAGETPANAGANGQGAGGGGSRSRRRRKSGSGHGKSAGNGGQSEKVASKQAGSTTGDREESMEESLTLEEQGEVASRFVSGLVREFGLEANVAFVELDEDTVQVAADGDDLGLLVGPRGATLAAVQDLTRTFVQRQSETRTDRILVDVGGYREKRAAALRRFTEGIVDEVKSSGEERALEPMTPADRKVVHDTVNAIEGVETRSDGIEPSRYVVIQPSS